MRRIKNSQFMGALIRTAYLPDEIPPAITTKSFAAFCEKEYPSLAGDLQKILKTPTAYDTFTAPKGIGGRRRLALVHPLAQIAMSLVLTSNKKKIRDHIGRSTHTLYDTESDFSDLDFPRAFSGVQFRKRDELEPSICSRFPYAMQADISKFFYTIYSHSIPWAVIGKDVAKDLSQKDRKKLDSHWSGQLDKAIQMCQSRETFGIPVGPDTSRIVAEILLSGVESDAALREHIESDRGFRVVDDFFVGYGTIETAQQALDSLREVLWKYNLQLNDEKTAVVKTSSVYRPKWRSEFSRIRISTAGIVKQRNDIRDLIEIALQYCNEFDDHRPATWACVRLLRVRIHEQNTKFALESMIRLARDFPGCISRVSEFIVNNRAVCYRDNERARIEGWLKDSLAMSFRYSYDFESAWLLVIAGVLDIKLSSEHLPDGSGFPCSAVLAILGMLRQRGILDTSLERWSWRARLRANGIYSSDWLLTYEAVRRKWTRDKEIVADVSKDPILSKMLSDQVTFLEPAILKSSHIDTVGRRFNVRRKPAGAAMQRVGRSEERFSGPFGEGWSYDEA